MISENMIKLVQILNDGHFHTGEEIGEKLAISRSAVWKIIAKLKEHQIAIDAVKHKGYALLEPLILLNPKMIKKGIKTHLSLVIFESINSTNDYLKTYFNQSTKKICLAEKQTQGRGRLNRQWDSPFGKNIYLSLLYPFKQDVSQLSGLSLVMGLAIIATLENLGLSKPLKIKWPNDIIYDDKKLAGILIELQAETHGNCKAIIGIGININVLPKDKNFVVNWTSLRSMTGEYIDRNNLCIQLINNLLSFIKIFEKEGLSYFHESWKTADYLWGKNVGIKQNGVQQFGKVKGIDVNGNLLLKNKEGVLQAFSAGDASILK